MANFTLADDEKKTVISQSMYFPWVGFLEQVKIADVFIHYDDVQYARGFYNRVQVKTESGSKWMTVPLRGHRRGQRIDEVLVDNRTDWRSQHKDILKQAYLNAPHRDEMLSLVDKVFSKKIYTLQDISRESTIALARYFNICNDTEFLDSSNMRVQGASSQRLHDLCVAVEADRYITGHGAKNYLDHELFERSKIKIEYMDYKMLPYSQLYSGFNPYVTALDLVANCGKKGGEVICSTSVYWKEFLNESS